MFLFWYKLTLSVFPVSYNIKLDRYKQPLILVLGEHAGAQSAELSLTHQSYPVLVLHGYAY